MAPRNKPQGISGLNCVGLHPTWTIIHYIFEILIFRNRSLWLSLGLSCRLCLGPALRLRHWLRLRLCLRPGLWLRLRLCHWLRLRPGLWLLRHWLRLRLCLRLRHWLCLRLRLCHWLRLRHWLWPGHWLRLCLGLGLGLVWHIAVPASAGDADYLPN
jgi:hypothetical protein